MPEALATERARNIFYAVTVFSCFLLLALAFETSLYLLRESRSDHRDAETKLAVSIGKSVWDRYDCVGCHTMLGEGAYFASELGDVYLRYKGSYAAIRDLIRRPINITGRRLMPKYDLTEKELQGLIEFFKYNSTIITAYWPSLQ